MGNDHELTNEESIDIVNPYTIKKVKIKNKYTLTISKLNNLI